ncbi:MAG: hypothetical protein WDN72_03940 [Alphaproteobacteria bacterium]
MPSSARASPQVRRGEQLAHAVVGIDDRAVALDEKGEARPQRRRLREEHVLVFGRHGGVEVLLQPVDGEAAQQRHGGGGDERRDEALGEQPGDHHHEEGGDAGDDDVRQLVAPRARHEIELCWSAEFGFAETHRFTLAQHGDLATGLLWMKRAPYHSVIPAKAGISLSTCASGERDSRLRGNDDVNHFGLRILRTGGAPAFLPAAPRFAPGGAGGFFGVLPCSL